MPKKNGGTKTYKDAVIIQMMKVPSGMSRDEGWRVNIKDRVLADIEDGKFARVEFYCVGNREISFGELATKLLIEELKIGNIQFEIKFSLDGKPAKRILI